MIMKLKDLVLDFYALSSTVSKMDALVAKAQSCGGPHVREPRNELSVNFDSV